ncbi:MAG: hypothetical protein HDQ97_13795 [Lachnospiraceae bacterium]|nr:hypothetical protein [Lachnospiraceae bacterium]
MTKIIVSSLLIIGILIIRAVFQKKISPIFIYAIWLLAAFRLLMPGMLLFSPISVMNTRLWNMGSALITEEENRQDMEYKRQMYQEYCEKKLAAAYEKEVELDHTGEKGELSIARSEEEVATTAGIVKELSTDIRMGTEETVRETEDYAISQLLWSGTFFGRIRQAARMIWVMGMLVIALSFLWQNLSFYRYLLSTRRKIAESAVGGRKLPVFQAGDKLTSPCLFGLYPAIYIPEGSIDIKDTEQLGFALEHELTHYRHGDHIWALIRILCLVINWYNPLAWIAAKLSLRDGELACDAGCIRRLGEEKRCAYGEALLAAIGQSRERERVLKTATMMTAGGKFMKRRMENIARKRENSVIAVAVMMISMLLVAGCTYTGGTKPEESRSDTAETTSTNTNSVQEEEGGEKESETANEESYDGRAVVLRGEGEGLNGNLQGMVFLLLPGPVKERSEEKYVVLLPDDLWLLDLEGNGKKMETIFQEYADKEILEVINRNLDLDLDEIEVWGYDTLINKVEEAGGILVDVKEAEIQHINNYQLMMTGKGELAESQVTESGEQMLDGIQTAAYLQIRYFQGGYFGMMDRWEQVTRTLLKKEGQEIIDYDCGYFAGDKSVYVEDDLNYLLCLCFEEELERFHEIYYPDRTYQTSDYVKEADQMMKEQAEKVIEEGRSEANEVVGFFNQYIGKSSFIISLLSGASLDPEAEDAWRTVKVYVSSKGLIVDEEAGKAVFSIGLVFKDSGVLSLPEYTDENPLLVERFLYLTEKEDGWYVDGLLHNNLPPKEWWDGAQMQWEVYDFGFSDEDAVGKTTSSQTEYDAFAKEVQNAADNKEQIDL